MSNQDHLSSKVIRFKVEDTGRGIPHAKLDDIFAPFSQLSSSTNQQEGTGLGLTISRDLIQLMGGQIQVESQVAQGTKFWFDLEIQEIAAKRLPPQSDVISMTQKKLNTPQKILVVDDLEDNRSLLVKYLQSLNFTLKSAKNGQEGLDIAKKFEPHAILTDLSMPIMNGGEMITKIKQQPNLKNTVIIAISANDNFSLQLSDINCHDFLSKPVDCSQLLRSLETHLQLDWQSRESTIYKCSLPDMIAPEQQDLLSLLEVVQIGDLEAIEFQIKALEAENEQYSPFVQEVRQLAKSFQQVLLKQFIQQFVNNQAHNNSSTY
ncbi:MAG: ATP-binding protein [Cyanobacteria bacterium P01_A01_bin.40]